MKRLITILLALTFLIAIVPAAQAYQIKTYRIDGYSFDRAGEFSVLPIDFASVLDNYSSNAIYQGAKYQYFQSFCVQKYEGITTNVLYNASISDATVAGDEQLTLGAAFLYNRFARGILAGYDYADIDPTAAIGGREASAGALQNALWYLMGRGDLTTGAGFVALADSMIDDDLLAASNGKYGVHILNVFGLDGSDKQDLLIYDPVPEPATMLLLGFGLIGLAGIRRKTSK